jgi:hypothetical protein
MRSALLALCLVGCIPQDDGWEPSGGNGWGSGWGGTGGNAGFGCETDGECGSLVCARTGECLSASRIHVVRTVWTVNDAVASDTSCRRAPELSITFYAGAEQFGFTPVPCDAGKHTVDKMPTRFTSVTLARRDDYSGGASGTFDAMGTATLDLPY